MTSNKIQVHFASSYDKDIPMEKLMNMTQSELEKDDNISPYISMEYPEDQISKQIRPDEIVIPMQTIKVLYDYPLHTEVTLEFSSENQEGFTRADLARKIAKGYKKIYREEHKAVANAGKTVRNIPGMLNRETTKGPYGIWGHAIGDLVLHTVTQEHDNVFSLIVDS